MPVVLPSHIPCHWPLALPGWRGDISHSLSFGAGGSLPGEPQVAGEICNAPSLHVMYPGLPQFFFSQAPCRGSGSCLGAVALHPLLGGGADRSSDARVAPGQSSPAPPSLLPGSLLPAVAHSAPPLALPQSERWLAGGLAVGQRLCTGVWGLTAWYLLGRRAGHRGGGGGAGAGFSSGPL